MNLDPLSSLLAAVVVLLIGTLVNRRVSLLSKYNIPDPITGGLLFAMLAALVMETAHFKVTIDQSIKPVLLLMFFAGVGLGADLRTLRRGGKALVIFLILLLPYIVVQNAVGIAMAKALDLHPIFGLVSGSITLVGGHGTGAAYAERFSEVNNLQSVMDLSMTVATLGLIVGGIIAGPVAQFLITRYRLRSEAKEAATDTAQEAAPPIATVGAIGALAGIFAAVVISRWLAARFTGGSITIPAFLWCMMTGIAIRNLSPFIGLRFDDRATELISNVCLSLFLVMTMMALDLIEVALSAGPFLVIIGMQIVFVILYVVFVCFRFMGRDYEAAVSSAAFIGFNMGSTATAMANMQAITAKHGPAPTSYLIAPLAGAFFVDLMNAFVLTLMLALPFMGG
ncbi:Sodium/glutamate symporter [Caballeronia glathei]|jgi:ESS family glutamate:Na+ symporter|uniref:Sodium/glutamate symporter n=1 Tax=Caballeronia glathei TaxID=60547 RepID=A0A069PFR7_9BURK|nr:MULTISPECIES: sodium/glutamate symporter [Burkholderiaceae]KDR39450.1 ABC transporter permease [Caballeronia glathei]TCK38822.1 ESS family glutamate:Na+ symporter [Paraburkholderia sp. BL8N3]CDY79369.1 Sodium/glutamate symporter [Caballeronia glathei]